MNFVVCCLLLCFLPVVCVVFFCVWLCFGCSCSVNYRFEYRSRASLSYGQGFKSEKNPNMFPYKYHVFFFQKKMPLVAFFGGLQSPKGAASEASNDKPNFQYGLPSMDDQSVMRVGGLGLTKESVGFCPFGYGSKPLGTTGFGLFFLLPIGCYFITFF